MSAERLIANLLRVAREDLEAARLLASASNRNAIYLCEQSAEKISPPFEVEWEEAWRAEIARRVSSIAEGRAGAISATELIEKLEATARRAVR